MTMQNLAILALRCNTMISGRPSNGKDISNRWTIDASQSFKVALHLRSSLCKTVGFLVQSPGDLLPQDLHPSLGQHLDLLDNIANVLRINDGLAARLVGADLSLWIPAPDCQVRDHVVEEVSRVGDDDGLEGEHHGPTPCMAGTEDDCVDQFAASWYALFADDLEGASCGCEFGLLAGRWLDDIAVDDCGEVVAGRGPKVDSYASDGGLGTVAGACAIDVNKERALFSTFSLE